MKSRTYKRQIRIDCVDSFPSLGTKRSFQLLFPFIFSYYESEYMDIVKHKKFSLLFAPLSFYDDEKNLTFTKNTYDTKVVFCFSCHSRKELIVKHLSHLVEEQIIANVCKILRELYVDRIHEHIIGKVVREQVKHKMSTTTRSWEITTLEQILFEYRFYPSWDDTNHFRGRLWTAYQSQ